MLHRSLAQLRGLQLVVEGPICENREGEVGNRGGEGCGAGAGETVEEISMRRATEGERLGPGGALESGMSTAAEIFSGFPRRISGKDFQTPLGCLAAWLNGCLAQWLPGCRKT